MSCQSWPSAVRDFGNGTLRPQKKSRSWLQTNTFSCGTDILAGYDFKSLREIAPFLEPSGSGISSLWARTTALRYNTTVVVGYPEKVDVTPRWPTSPEYYNSALVVDQDGQTIGNYRKSFLYRTDETWALEGRDGFFGGEIPGLGQTVMGIGEFSGSLSFQRIT